MSSRTPWCLFGSILYFPGTGKKVKYHSVRVHFMIGGGVPNTHTTLCISVLYSLQFLPISFPNRALPMGMVAGIACSLFIFLAYFLVHWFYTLDFSRSYVLVPAALICWAYQPDTLCSPWLLLTLMTNSVQQTELDSHYLREGEKN